MLIASTSSAVPQNGWRRGSGAAELITGRIVGAPRGDARRLRQNDAARRETLPYSDQLVGRRHRAAQVQQRAAFAGDRFVLRAGAREVKTAGADHQRADRELAFE